MKIFLLILILLITTAAQAQKITPAGSEEIKIETVNFCELIKNPTRYEKKKIRIAAIWAYGGEDHNVLYCPQCYTNGVIKPSFADLEKRNSPGKLPRRKRSSGTLKIIAVGEFSQMRFVIEKLEKADYISKNYHFPDKLPAKVRRRATCSPE